MCQILAQLVVDAVDAIDANTTAKVTATSKAAAAARVPLQGLHFFKPSKNKV